MTGAFKAISGLLLLAAPLRAAPELVGVFVASGIERFALTDPDRRQPICWMQIGQQFEGYTVVEYRDETETLSLRNDIGMTRLALRRPKVAESSPDPDAMLAIAKQAVARNERWAGPIRYQGPHLFKNNWIVVAHHDLLGGTETRVVVFSALGVMWDYLVQPARDP